MKEDPLERLDRLEAEKRAGKNPAKLVKTLTVVAVVLGVILLGLSVFTAKNTIDNNELVSALTEEKNELAREFQALQGEFSMMADSLGTKNEQLSSQLDSSQAEVAILYEKLQRTQATNRAEIRKYQKELGTLRAIMRDYVKQIDSLNTVNKKLTADVAAARRDAAESKRAYQSLSSQTDELQKKVNIGSAVKISGAISFVGRKKDGNRNLDRHQNVERLLATFTLAANDLTPKGPLTIYAVVKDSEDVILVNSSSTSFSCNGQTMTASASRTVDYEGNDLEMTIYLNDISVEKGTYRLELYSDKGLCGSTEIYFR